ncbi:hypothetical protein L6258_01015 [Candidatus Parcubacteria bacterium]|nr:hypothetical protein [Candidatus Parcubacteria bacterium]
MPETINLLVKKPLESYPLPKKFLWWALGIGRVIIIGTEIIVLIVFGARFKLDRDISDLSEKIEAKQAIVRSFTEFETKFRTAQTQLKLIKEILSEQRSFVQGITFLTTLVPQGVSFYDLDIEPDRFTISAKAVSGREFSRLLAYLISEEDIGAVTLVAAHLDPGEQVYKFTLDLGVGKEAFEL